MLSLSCLIMHTSLIQISSTGVLHACPKGHCSSDIQDFVFRDFSDGSPFHTVMASGWHHQKALQALLFDGETSDVFKRKHVPDLRCNLSSVLNYKAYPVCLGGCFCSIYLGQLQRLNNQLLHFLCGTGGKSPASFSAGVVGQHRSFPRQGRGISNSPSVYNLLSLNSLPEGSNFIILQDSDVCTCLQCRGLIGSSCQVGGGCLRGVLFVCFPKC